MLLKISGVKVAPCLLQKISGVEVTPSVTSVELSGVFANSARGTKPLFWIARDALGQDKQKAHIIKNGNFLCLPSRSAILAHLHYRFFFVPREWLAAKGLLSL